MDRMRQLKEYFDRIPVAEKSQRSLLEAWNAMFDVHAIVPRALAKDHCDYCKKPLMLIRKQAQLQCSFCARMTEHLMPVAHANAWMKTNVNAQPENKRLKIVWAKLNQCVVGSPPIPPEIILGVRQVLKSRAHNTSSESLALPGPVAAALTALNHDKYVPYAAKIANVVNGLPVCELRPEQIAEVVSRLRIVQFIHNILSASGKLSSRQFYTNYNVNQIALIMGLPALASLFPIQKGNRRQLRDQTVAWKQLLHYLLQIDSLHSWK